jgi:hypothetical protein
MQAAAEKRMKTTGDASRYVGKRLGREDDDSTVGEKRGFNMILIRGHESYHTAPPKVAFI